MWESEHRHGTDANSVSVVSECVVELLCYIVMDRAFSNGMFALLYHLAFLCMFQLAPFCIGLLCSPVLHLLACLPATTQTMMNSKRCHSPARNASKCRPESEAS